MVARFATMLGLKHIKWEEVVTALGYTLLFGLVYAGLYLSMGEPFEFGGPCWSTVLIWIFAQIFGFLFQLVRLPALLGMLLSGMLLKNGIPSAIHGFPRSWSSGFRAMALCTIFLRSGLELDMKVFKRVGPVAVRLLLIPGLVEAFVDGGTSIGVFKMPVFYAFTLGFILKAVGPAIVIQTMFDLQKRGLGVNKGIPSTVVGAASFDDMVAITGYTLFSNLAIRDPSQSFAWQMMQGPLNIVFGCVGGLLGAMFCSCTTMWNTRVKRAIVVFATAQSLMFFFYTWDFKSGGALASLILGLVVNVLWAKGRNVPFFKRIPGYMSKGPNERYAHEVEHYLGIFWRWVAQPLLFGIIGTLMNFRAPGFQASYIPRAIIVIVVGLCARIPVTFLSMCKAGLTWREKAFVAAAWTPKATVQAALGAMPLDKIIKLYGKDSPEVAIGDQILTTSVFAILICATVGVMAIQILAPRWLDKMDTMKSNTVSSADLLKQGKTDVCEDGGETAGQAADEAVDTALPLEANEQPKEIQSEGDAMKPEEKLKHELLEAMRDRVLGQSTKVDSNTVTASDGGEITADPVAPASGKTKSLVRPVKLSQKSIDALTLQDKLEAEMLESVDEVLARYLASIEQLVDLVEKKQITPEQCRDYASKLRANVRGMRKKILTAEGLSEESNDSETATTFFRLADRVLHQSPAVELTDVAVARAS